ncbi:MAG: arginine N-succinyltransferase [Oceanospirillaceae bacterium]
MLVFRAVCFADLPAIEHLAIIAGSSMTTLPNNRDHLAELINSTKKSLQQNVKKAAQQSYHFVLQDTDTKEIIGICGIEANVGFSAPFYSYCCDKLEHHCAPLQIQNTIDTLRLSQDYEGSSRLCTFFIADKNYADASFALPLLSLPRLMFIGQHPQRFMQKIMLELQGIIDSNKQSPFWQALGQHFFSMDFHKANYLTGINAKGFIADLMPQYPVYVPLLANSAQQVIGKVRPDLQKVATLLKSEGFSFNNYVSIFDGGPTLEAAVNDLKTVKLQFSTPAIIQETTQETASSDRQENLRIGLQEVLISNNALSDYRCIYAKINIQAVSLTPQQSHALKVTAGDTLYVLPLSTY